MINFFSFLSVFRCARFSWLQIELLFFIPMGYVNVLYKSFIALKVKIDFAIINIFWL